MNRIFLRRISLLSSAAAIAACSAALDLPDPTLDPTLGNDGSAAADASGDGGNSNDATTSDVATDGGGACEGIDFQTNAAHCGRCNHDCLGGLCDTGKCKPVLLAQNQGRTLKLATDDTTLYWTDRAQGVLKSTSKNATGGTLSQVKVLATGFDEIRGVAVDQNYVYFTSEYFTPPGGVHRCLKTGCDADAAVSLFAAGEFAFDLLLKGGYGYFSATNEGVLRRVDLADGGILDIGTNITQPFYVAADDQNAYCSSNMNIMQYYQLDGGGKDAYGPQPGTGTGIAADGTRVVYNDVLPDSGGTVRMYTAADGIVEMAHGIEPKSVALDANHIYLTFQGTSDGTANGSLAMCPITGCLSTGPEVLVGGLVSPNTMLIDNDAIYYATIDAPIDVVGSGRIWKLAKP